MPAKRRDNPKNSSFRLSLEARQLLFAAAQQLSHDGPYQVSQTNVLEMAIREFCQRQGISQESA